MSGALRRISLTFVMVLMGAALVAGSAVAILPTALLPLDQQIGTNASAAAAALGIGIMAAGVNPAGHIGWVRVGILYGPIVLGYQAGAYFLLGAPFHIGPVIFGIACSLLMIALYPHRGTLIPPIQQQVAPSSVPAP